MQACGRRRLAEESQYEYPRGGETVTGPSIRLAEALAQNWGNMDFGIVELEQRKGESTVMAYAWDLETNTRQTKIFNVPHTRHTRKGSYDLKDPRDVYELVANQGARRLRACILGVIPGDVVEAAVEKCNKTLSSAAGDKPLVDRVRTMLEAFSEQGVTQDMIEGKLRHKAATISEIELGRLRKIFASIRDGMSVREDHFDTMTNDPATGDLEERIAKQQAAPPKSPAQADAESGSGSAPGSADAPPAGDGSQVDPDEDAKLAYEAFVGTLQEMAGEGGMKAREFNAALKAHLERLGLAKGHEMTKEQRKTLHHLVSTRAAEFEK
jgi:hypothetical protein